ncbi:MAG: hypothetical protein WEC75_11195 [Dehalococcoidia bacterium]
MSGADELRWARRVKPEKIRRLYAFNAKGIIDEELVDEVGYAMLARCEAIRTVTYAHAGRATCPRCRAIIAHAWKKDEALVCECGWSATWGQYLKSYQGRQLHGGSGFPAFKAFIAQWPHARTPEEKMLTIDRLVHAFHAALVGPVVYRPAACNVIEGTATELLGLLEELAYGDLSTPGLRETRDAWAEAVAPSYLQRRRRGLSDRPPTEGEASARAPEM